MSTFLDTKTSMIVYALEKSLGSYIKRDNGSRNVDLLQEHFDARSAEEIEKGRGVINNTSALIEASYISDIFNYALIISKGSSDYEKLNELKDFCIKINLFFIRNQISHPSRTFHDHYWYCAAAIASHPMIEALQLNLVQESFYAALSGQLKEPPEEWLKQVSWEIENNLPEKFDHDITSLIGRKNEKKEVLKAINNKRINFIAIVAPGGVGKTALALDFLKELSLSPDARNEFGRICYVTLKKHHLTVDGIKELENVDSIIEIKKEILYFLEPESNLSDDGIDSLFENTIEKQNSSNILLCIDNLETLLRDGPEEFIRFQYSLPSNFKVMVTSRVMVDGAYPIILKELQSSGAEHLARSYSDKKGMMNITHQELVKIAKFSHYNPLAIRLTIDAVHSGVPVPDSIEKAKKDIAAFSYNNLIETLSDEAVLILECLFISGSVSRNYLSHFLEMDQDLSARAIKELANTSLISRSSSSNGEDLFSLSESVKELLMLNPRNTAARSQLAEKERKQRQSLLHLQKFQTDKEIHKFDYRYIPHSCPESLQILINETNRILVPKNPNRDKIILSYEKFRTLQQIYNKEAIFLRTYSRLLAALGDYPTAISTIKSAIKLEEENPLNKLTLVYFFKDWGDFIEAQNTAQELINEGFDDPDKSGSIFSATITKEYLGVHLYGKEYSDVIEYTNDWKKSNHIQEVSYFRVAALKRSIENTYKIDLGNVITHLREIIYITEFIFNNYELNERLADEGIKAIYLVENIITEGVFYPQEFINDMILFAEKNLSEMTKYSKSFNMKSKDVIKIIRTFMMYKTPNNPFKEKKWMDFTDAENQIDFELKTWERNGYIIVEIYNDLTIDKGFVFAKKNDGEEFLIHIDSCININKSKWTEFKKGRKLAIKFTKTKKGFASSETHQV
ncbi:hypothetical protein F0T03_05435 [Yersinia canariae]|uniref:Uncharacterized protein n=1 Tax=Yersinia canariae TaxID=2607663 RepID=A0A857EX38_9GAMM|nr:ATP-binding protein [Yersinia canariae]QHB31661.1 hypothetical protein F0T03_05435 [Yersinia canariae]